MLDRVKTGLLAACALVALALPAGAQTTLNVATAGDQNLVDYVKDYLGPMFEKANPGVKVVAVGFALPPLFILFGVVD